MASTAPAAARPSTRHPGITMTTRLRIELRKLVDTRSAAAVLAVTCGLVLLVVGVTGAFQTHEADLRTLTDEGAAPLVFLLPVVGMLAITGEWRHHTALFTYAVDPARSRVLTAKLLAVALLTLAMLAAMIGAALLVLLAVGAPMPGVGETLEVAGTLLWAVGGMTLLGAALGSALLSAPLALTVFFLLPQVLPQLLRAWAPTEFAAEYVDAQAVFLGGMADLTDIDVSATASVIVVWIVLPLVVGFVRNARRDA